MCSEEYKEHVRLPPGWEHINREIDDETHAFCPAHKEIAEFQGDQCAGCIGGWGDCDLWKSFAYNKLKLTDNDFKKIKEGVCPKRTNGTFGFNPADRSIEDIDLSEPSSNKSGLAFEKAIKDYCSKYHEED